MSWAHGFDRGREVGYGVMATCDKRGCEEVIDRGLGWRCGDARNLHDETYGCGRFYCAKHLGGVGPRGGCDHGGKRAWGRVIPNPDHPEKDS